MSTELKELIKSGQLSEALNHCMTQLRAHPSDLDLRSQYIELLCIDGQLERADQQLSLLVKQHPSCLPSSHNMRQLVHAAQARIDFSQGGDTALAPSGVNANLAAMLELRLGLSQGDNKAVEKAVQSLESTRQAPSCELNGEVCKELRDIDDSLCGYLEVFGTNGHYYLVPLAQISWLKLLPAESLVEFIWRRAELDICNGPSGEVFIPLTYLGSESDAEKLGLESDWSALLDTPYYIGRGLKMWLHNDDALPLSQLDSLSITEKACV